MFLNGRTMQQNSELEKQWTPDCNEDVLGHPVGGSWLQAVSMEHSSGCPGLHGSRGCLQLCGSGLALLSQSLKVVGCMECIYSPVPVHSKCSKIKTAIMTPPFCKLFTVPNVGI